MATKQKGLFAVDILYLNAASVHTSHEKCNRKAVQADSVFLWRQPGFLIAGVHSDRQMSLHTKAQYFGLLT